MADQETRECPFCKEEINAEAIKCKHCRSSVTPKAPSHGGICPYCKEEIKPDAIKCKHCGTMVGNSVESAGCAGCAEKTGLLDTVALNALISGSGIRQPPQGTFESGVAALASCSGCGRFGQTAFGFRVCCKRVYIPFLGYQTVCWAEPCYVGPILTA